MTAAKENANGAERFHRTAAHELRNIGVMVPKLRTLLNEFKSARSGERFQTLYRRREGRQNNLLARSLFLIVGLAIMASGVFLMPAPGPGTIVLIIGGAIAAQESLRVARLMDWCERRIYWAVRRAARWWRNRSLPAKTLLIALSAAAVTSLSFAGYRVLASIYAGGF
jgi:uncharacterized protein (TIGR02611 family)